MRTNDCLTGEYLRVAKRFGGSMTGDFGVWVGWCGHLDLNPRWRISVRGAIRREIALKHTCGDCAYAGFDVPSSWGSHALFRHLKVDLIQIPDASFGLVFQSSILHRKAFHLYTYARHFSL